MSTCNHFGSIWARFNEENGIFPKVMQALRLLRSRAHSLSQSGSLKAIIARLSSSSHQDLLSVLRARGFIADSTAPDEAIYAALESKVNYLHISYFWLFMSSLTEACFGLLRIRSDSSESPRGEPRVADSPSSLSKSFVSADRLVSIRRWALLCEWGIQM